MTTRITDAVPITMPSPVSSERTGLARSACALNCSASPRNMDPGHQLPCACFRSFAGVGARRDRRGSAFMLRYCFSKSYAQHPDFGLLLM